MIDQSRAQTPLRGNSILVVHKLIYQTSSALAHCLCYRVRHEWVDPVRVAPTASMASSLWPGICDFVSSTLLKP